MTRASLQTILFGVLLIFNHGSFQGTAARNSRCLTQEQLENKLSKFNEKKTILTELPTPLRRSTCEQVARETKPDLRHRSLSPWRYSIYHVDGLSHGIIKAECLCEGCIINQREDLSYNSVPVLAPLLVLVKAECPGDPNKYTVKRAIIRIPVACTCVAPRTCMEYLTWQGVQEAS